MDRQASNLRKSAVRSVKPATLNKKSVPLKPKSSVKILGYSSKPILNPRVASVKIAPNWKVCQELDFNRMVNLYLQAEGYEDMYVFKFL